MQRGSIIYCNDNAPREDGLLYQQLNGSQIRLLTFHSRGVFGLDTFSLQDCPEYAAVSYCWGKATTPVHLSINGHGVWLAEHVCSMLYTLCREHNPTYIWIDSICINQADKEDKSRQISMMGTIYSQASIVFAWLGEADDASDLVFDVLREFHRCKTQRWPQSGFDAAEQLASDRDMFCNIYISRAGHLPDQSADDDDEMLHQEFNWLRPLYIRDYWKRTWIVQEAVLAKRLLVCCGDNFIEFEHIYGLSLDWGSFEQGFNTGNHRRLKPVSKGWITIQAICGHRRRRSRITLRDDALLDPEQYATLDEIVEIYAQEHHCTDFRDKVYGFRALSEQWMNLTVDDTKTVLEVFMDATQPGHFTMGPESVLLAARLFSAMNLGSTEAFFRLVSSTHRFDSSPALILSHESNSEDGEELASF